MEGVRGGPEGAGAPPDAVRWCELVVAERCREVECLSRAKVRALGEDVEALERDQPKSARTRAVSDGEAGEGGMKGVAAVGGGEGAESSARVTERAAGMEAIVDSR